MLTFLPAFEHIGGVRIKLAAIFASWSGIGSHPVVEPLPHGSRFHPKTKSNLLRSQSLLTQGDHLLIALLSLCTPRGNGLLHAFLLRGPPFLERQEAVSLHLRRSFSSLAGRFHLEEDTCQELLDGFRQVLVGWEADEVPHCCCPFSTPFPQTHRAAFTAMGFPMSSFYVNGLGLLVSLVCRRSRLDGKWRITRVFCVFWLP